MIPIPPFEPDKSRFNPLATGDLKNCIPVLDGWRPMPDLSVISEALGSKCKGAVTVRKSDGTYSFFAGTTTGLYRLDPDFSWEDVSGSSAPYSVPPTDRWSFTIYGTKLIAHSIADVVQVFDVETDTTFSDLGGTPPKAKYSFVIGEFLVLAHLEANNSAVHWSGIGDITEWVPGEKGGDIQSIPAGGEIMGGIANDRGAVVIQKTAMQYMQFSPASGYTFTFSPANDKRGVISAGSIVQIGADDFVYLSEDGFFRGVAGQPIGGQRVDRWFFDNVARNNVVDVRGVADPFEKIVWWSFLDTSGESYLIGYHWQIDRWCFADGGVEELVTLASPPISIDGADAYYATIDEAIAPFDSRLFKGGAMTFAAFTSGHQLATYAGSNRACEAYTADVQINQGGRYFVNGARILTDAQAATLTLGAADYAGDAMEWKGPVAMSSRTKFVGIRSDGRLHNFKIDIPAGTNWSILTGIDVQGGVSGA